MAGKASGKFLIELLQNSDPIIYYSYYYLLIIIIIIDLWKSTTALTKK